MFKNQYPIYNPVGFQTEIPIDSFWRASAPELRISPPYLKTDHISAEIVVIGGGFTGLNAALTLSRDYGRDVILLEAGLVGAGASGRNGGFCCIGGSKLGYEDMMKRFGKEATKHFYDTQVAAVNHVDSLLTRYNIDADKVENGEICIAHKAEARAGLEAENHFLNKEFGAKTSYLEKEELEEQGLTCGENFGAAFNPVGFGLHPLKYVRGLAKAAHEEGVRIFENSRLIKWEKAGNAHLLHTEDFSIRANQVVFATNGYTPENIIPPLYGKTLPAMSSILTTRPLTQSELENQGWTRNLSAFDSRILLHYFRLLPDNRILFGGRGGTDSSDAAMPALRVKLRQAFDRCFPKLAHVEESHFWRGFVCLARNLTPYTGPLNEAKTVWTSLAYHGNGVAMGSWSGQALAHEIAGQSEKANIPQIMQGKLGAFPLPMFRRFYLKGAYLHYGFQDGFD